MGDVLWLLLLAATTPPQRGRGKAQPRRRSRRFVHRPPQRGTGVSAPHAAGILRDGFHRSPSAGLPALARNARAPLDASGDVGVASRGLLAHYLAAPVLTGGSALRRLMQDVSLLEQPAFGRFPQQRILSCGALRSRLPRAFVAWVR